MSKKIDRKLTSVALLVLMIIIFSVNKPLFFSVGNFSSILRDAASVGIISCGATFVIITGGIDNSVGSMMALSAMVCANMLKFYQLPLILVLLVTLILSTLMGSVNGVLVAKLKIPDFIVTLATMNIYRGLTRALNRTDVESLQHPMIENEIFGNFGGKVGNIYYVTILMLVMIFIAYYILKHTKMGLYTYAVGSNAKSAALTGISFKKIKIFAYTLTGFCCGVDGIMSASRMMTATTETGSGMEFSVISAIVIGGCSLQGGRGDMIGTLIGTLLMAVINSGITLLGVSTYYQSIIKGVVILAAVLLDIAYASLAEKKLKQERNKELAKEAA